MQFRTRRTYIIILVFATLLFFLVFFQLSSMAASDLNPEVSNTEDSVQFSFNVTGDEYEVLKDNKTIKKGTNTDQSLLSTNNNKKTIKLDKLGSDVPVQLKLRMYDNKKVTNEIIVETSTLRSEKDKKSFGKNPLSESNLTSYISHEEVEMEWNGVPDDDNVYEIYKD